MKRIAWIVPLMLVATAFLPEIPPRAQSMIDDFESYSPNGLPNHWTVIRKNGQSVPLAEAGMNSRERVYVVQEGRNKFLHVYTHGEAIHVDRVNGKGIDWDIRQYPKLRWQWRAQQLPAGAREDNESFNDAGIALYVVFSTDALRRPRSIKYTYSSTLPVGTVVSYGRLKVLVASSGRDGVGDWTTVERDVAADYRRLFGGEPPHRPLSIRLWGDSDNTGAEAIADFDNLMLLQ
jgi:hypothetical protein